MVKSKYQSVLDLGQQLKFENGDVSEENGVLKIKGTAKNQYEKNLLWDKIKAVGGENPSDIQADIKVADTSIFARHTVKSGETLGKIAKQYYGDASKYQKIFAANSDILKNPDVIQPNQELIIPNLNLILLFKPYYNTCFFILLSAKANNFSNCASNDKWELSISMASSAFIKGESSLVESMKSRDSTFFKTSS